MLKDSIETIKEKDYDLIIFDCDGTLVDSEFLSNSVVAQMIREQGIDISDEQAYKTFAGTSMSRIINYINEGLDRPLDFDFEAEFRPRVKRVFEESLEAMKGVVTFIEQLSIDKCVASNGPRVKMETTLAVTGLDNYFGPNEIFSAYDIQQWKPDPQLFLHAAQTLGCRPDKCLVIEDSRSGVEAALNAGIDVIVKQDPIDSSRTSSLGVPVFENFKTISSTFFEVEDVS